MPAAKNTNVDLSKLISGLDSVLKIVRDAAPLVESLGVPSIVANVATIGIAATATIENMLERGGKLKDALSTHDEAKLRAMLADLQTANDDLNEAIRDS